MYAKYIYIYIYIYIYNIYIYIYIYIYFLNYMLPHQLLYGHTPVHQAFLKSTMNIFGVFPCTWSAPCNYLVWGILLEVIAFQTWYSIYYCIQLPVQAAHYTSQLLVIVTARRQRSLSPDFQYFIPQNYTIKRNLPVS